MSKRSPILVVALTFVTFTLYAYYWLYKTTDELRTESGREELHPFLDVVLAALTFGLWGFWAAYRNARIVHELFEDDGVRHTDRSLPVALFAALTMVSGWAWLVSMAVLQEDLNRLADHFDELDSAPRSEGELGRRARVKARVEVEQEEASRDEPSSAAVFESSAPAPIVF